jgi:hypothetical protein
MTGPGDVVVVSGIRELAPWSEADVDMAMVEVLAARPREVRFGGARGADTVALRAACESREAPTRLRVYAPCRARDLTGESAELAAHCADSVVECGGDPRMKRSYLDRNDRMLDGATRLVAFTDGRAHGGTAYTIRAARKLGVAVEVVPVDAGGPKANPDLTERIDARAPVAGVFPYRRNEWRVQVVKRLKLGVSDPRLPELAGEVAAWLIGPEGRAALGDVAFLVPMPRRVPGVPSDLVPLALAVARAAGLRVLEDWLVRTQEPEHGAFMRYDRLRFPAAEHARTMAVRGDVGLAPAVALFDNVLTTSGTMVGAQMAVERDAGVAPRGLAVLYAGVALKPRRR